jgi:hypothetical protein
LGLRLCGAAKWLLEGVRWMAKLNGNLRITAVPGAGGSKPHFEVVFVPYAGRLNTKPATVPSYEDLVELLKSLKFDEDTATHWSGRARSQGIILISSFERNESVLRENGLLA